MYGTVNLPWLGPVNFRDQPCANKVNPLSRHIYVLEKSVFLDHFAIISVSVCFGSSRDHFGAIILGDHFSFFFLKLESAIILVGDHFSGYRLYMDLPGSGKEEL